MKTETQRWRVALFGKRLHIITDSSVEDGIRENTQRLEAGGVRVLGAREGRFSLEDVFISVVEQARERGENRCGGVVEYAGEILVFGCGTRTYRP